MVTSDSPGLRSRIGRWLLTPVGRLVGVPVRRQLARFERITHKPQQMQEELLARILARQARTQFGRDHHFDSIRRLGDFRRQVPVADYDYYEPYIARMRQGQFEALVAGERVLMFAMTSGTTAARKYVPVTPRYLEAYRRGWNVWGMKVFKDHPEVKLRPIVQLSGDWDEFRTEAGVPCGSVTGLTATSQKRLIRWLYCVPPECARVKDTQAKYYLALRLSVPLHPGMIIAANPSTLVNLARLGDQEKESLIRDIRDGSLSSNFDIPQSIRQAVGARLRKPNPSRAKELEEVVRRTGTLYPRDYWPRPCLLGNWTGGSVGAYLRHYPRYFGDAIVRDVGLIASEGRMTVPMADGTSGGVLDIDHHYFEFIPEAEIHSSHPTVLAAHELEEGGTYFILLTTSYGLYRYDIHDVVRVVGFHNHTPILEFLSKGAYFASITGEKLSEHHVTRAMIDVLREMDLNLSAYSVAPCWNDDLPYYSLLVERSDLEGDEQGIRLARLLDHRLGEGNIEYASKRETQRLGSIRLGLLPPGTWQQWDRQRLLRSGGTAEQYKHPCLISDMKFRDSMPVERELTVPKVVARIA
jgi:hypothetical protein